LLVVDVTDAVTTDPVTTDAVSIDPGTTDAVSIDPGTTHAGTTHAGTTGAVGAAEGPTCSDADDEPLLDLESLPGGPRGALEAVLMVIEEAVDEIALASALGISVERITELLTSLVVDYDEAGRGFELRRVAGGWRIFSRADYAPVVERFVLDGQTARLTQAALETLAIVAYRQPISRARVGAVRGVNVDAVMRTLTTRGLVEEDGTDPVTGAVLYRTTAYFLQRIGLSSIDELPALAPYLPEVEMLDELAAGGVS
jgi:segregation and condensation protein B